MIPAPANLHSHAFQRAMAGLAEVRGKDADTFWTWRETMYRFALMMSPDDVEAVAAQLYVEMLEAGFAAVAEFHYLHHAPDGSPYARARRNGGPNPVRVSTGRHRHDAASGVLRTRDLRRRAAETGAEAIHLQCRFLRAPRRGLPRFDQSPTTARRSASRRTAFGPLRRVNSPNSCRSPAAAPFTFTPPNRSRKSRTASRRSERARCDGCSITLTSTRNGASFMRRTWMRRRHETLRAPARSPGFARSPKPISATESSTGRLHPRRRTLRNRHGLQRVDWRRHGIASARICAKVTRARPERPEPGGRVLWAGDA